MQSAVFVVILGIGFHLSGETNALENPQKVNETLSPISSSSSPLRSDHQNVDSSRLQDVLSMVASMGSGSGRARESHSTRMDYDNSLVKRRKLKYDWDIKLDKSGAYKLNWRVNYSSNQVTFALELEQSEKPTDIDSPFRFHSGRDIFALGFSDYGELNSSDFCIVWFDLGHRIHLQDARTDEHNRLELIDSRASVCRLIHFNADARQGPQRENTQSKEDDDQEEEEDANETSTNESSHLAEVIFSRPLDVCEANNVGKYYTIDNGTTHLVWFTLRGPVLSLDGLDLTPLVASSRAGNATAAGTGGGAGHQQFDFGLTRVQLVAMKQQQQRQQSHHSESSDVVDDNDQRQPLGGKMHDVRMDKYEIPARETTYWCKLFKLPAKFESRKYHITSYEAIIGPGNEHVVHHMELFNCAHLSEGQSDTLNDLYERRGGWSGECSSPHRPPATQPCRKVILAWAMGARPLVYPSQVGQSIGGRDYSPYVVLEVHYNNVGRQAALVDSSGLRFHYTPRIRPFEAGVLEVGLEYTDKNSIPPGLVAPLAGHCVSECTRAAMSGSGGGRQRKTGSINDVMMTKTSSSGGGGKQKESATHSGEGIYIFAAQMHTHLAGVASWTEHIREGRRLRELQRDDHYSPHFQEIRLLPEPIHVLPGDALVHYCLYDTRKRRNITLGGFATADEMCVTYLHYYPRIDLEVCKSSVETAALQRYFSYLARQESQNTSLELLEMAHNDNMSLGVGLGRQLMGSKRSVSENYQAIDWSPRRSRELLQFYATAPLAVQCNRSNGERWPGRWNGVAPTVIWTDHEDGRAVDDDDDEEADNHDDHQEMDQLTGGSDDDDEQQHQQTDEQRLGRGPIGLAYVRRGPRGEPADYRGAGHGRRHAQCRRRGRHHHHNHCQRSHSAHPNGRPNG